MNKKFLGTVSCGVLVPVISSNFVFAQDVDVSNTADENIMEDNLFIKNNNESTVEKDLKTKPYLKYFAIAAVVLIADLVARYYIKRSIYEGLNELVDKLLPVYDKAIGNNLFNSVNLLVKELKNSPSKLSLLFVLARLDEKIKSNKSEEDSTNYDIGNALEFYSSWGSGIHLRFKRYFYSLFGLFELKNELSRFLHEFNENEVVQKNIWRNCT